MVIRNGFVSNSSSTAFLIISKDELSRTDFYRMMGISSSSPLIDVFAQLYDAVAQSSTDHHLKCEKDDSPERVDAWVNSLYERLRVRLTDHMMSKVDSARKDGFHVYCGMLSSDDGLVEGFFCCDSFEAESRDMYMNALECTW